MANLILLILIRLLFNYFILKFVGHLTLQPYFLRHVFAFFDAFVDQLLIGMIYLYKEFGIKQSGHE